MNLPLPAMTRDYFRNDKNRVLKISNLGLLFNKYFYCWLENWQNNEEQSKKFRKDIEGMISKMGLPKNEDYVEALIMRNKIILNNMESSGWQVARLEAFTDSRLIIGLGGTSVIETGMTLHPLYGFPYLPGSGLKGLARAYAEIGSDASKEDLLELFGSEDKTQYAENNRQGKVFFLDGLPTAFPRLELDIMNPHYGEYYRGEKPPADYLNPVPVTFLAVAPGQKFAFAVYSREKTFVDKAVKWLKNGLIDLGAGGKTNVGYGYFQIDDPPAQMTTTKNIPLSAEDNSLITRIKSVKNQRTFIEFVTDIKPDEIEMLNSISFKETGINIGYTDDLKSAEVSDDVKKIIACKIVEISTPNKKWDNKKHERYKKLCAMAGI